MSTGSTNLTLLLRDILKQHFRWIHWFYSRKACLSQLMMLRNSWEQCKQEKSRLLKLKMRF